MNDLFAEPRFVAGIGEFNSANFFEAHEIWEELWNDLLDDEKRACQSLIQIAAGYHKESIGNSLGARKLLERGLRGLAPLLPSRAWATEFRRHVAADLETLKRGAPRLSGSGRLYLLYPGRRSDSRPAVARRKLSCLNRRS